MKLSKIFTAINSAEFQRDRDVFEQDNNFNSISRNSCMLDKFHLPKEAKHIQFKFTKKKLPHSISTSCLFFFDDDFIDNRVPEEGNVELLWW